MIYLVHKETKEHRRYADAIEWPDADCRLVEADADGWITWTGGECPLPAAAYHQVMFLAGDTSTDSSPGTWRWEHDGDNSDIVAYRPILDAKPEAPAWDGGLPPEGCECELMRGAEWVPVKITGKGDRVIVFRRLCNVSREEITEAEADEFRPIRSEADKAVDAIARILADEFDACAEDCVSAARALYRNGYKQPEAS